MAITKERTAKTRSTSTAKRAAARSERPVLTGLQLGELFAKVGDCEEYWTEIDRSYESQRTAGASR